MKILKKYAKCRGLASRALPILFILLGSGCGAHIETTYSRPEIQTPAAWQIPADPAIEHEHRWWQSFGDVELDQLIEKALQQNNDLAAATVLVRKARLTADLTESEQLPSIDVGSAATLERDLRRNGREQRSYSASSEVGYEIDLWGKLQRATDKARWEALATEEDRAATELSLVGTVGSLYWQLGYLNQRIDLSQTSINYAKKTAELVELQKKAGAATRLEVLEAQRSLASQEASHASLVQQRAETKHALAILFNTPPVTEITTGPKNLASTRLPPVAAGLPASLLARRPDLQAAEMRLRSSLASVDATKAGFYPSISLTSSLGYSSDQLSRLFSNPVGSIGASLALPFLQWRDVQRNIKISEAEYENAVINFRQTLYSAMAEVEDCLSARQQYRIQEKQLALALDTAQQTEEIYRIRYQAGSVPLKTWLDSQEDRRNAEIDWSENRLNQLQNHITLYKALGGDTVNK